MHRIVVLLVVVGCSKGRPDDCAIVRDKPGEALAELSSRYPNNPVKVAETVEHCVAPSGEDCDRIAKIVAAIPNMTPSLAMPGKPADYAKTCREAPPEYRRCLLPSYTLAHSQECADVIAKLREAMTKPLEIRPNGGRSVGNEECGPVAIYIDKTGTWLATGRDDKSRCFAPRKGNALDSAWLEAQLRKVKAIECSPSAAELASNDDVPYREVIETMDTAVKTGFIDVGLASPADLTVPLATATPKGALTECPASVIAIEAKAPAGQPAAAADQPPPAHSGPDTLAKAPVLIVTRDKIELHLGDTTTAIATLAEARTQPGKLDKLTKALPASKGGGMLILQADESTPTTVINRVITTAKAAGYDNIMFAVKNR